jgi:selenocysteine lyase/cysteine desulfurase
MITPNEPGAIAGILAFRHPDADRINQRLHERSIHIMAHAGRLRVAIHGYNTMADVERFLSALSEVLNQG